MKNINKIKTDTFTVVRLTKGCSNYKYKREHEYKARIVVLSGGKKVLGIMNDAGIEEYHPLTTKSFCLLEDHEAHCQAENTKTSAVLAESNPTPSFSLGIGSRVFLRSPAVIGKTNFDTSEVFTVEHIEVNTQHPNRSLIYLSYIGSRLWYIADTLEVLQSLNFVQVKPPFNRYLSKYYLPKEGMLVKASLSNDRVIPTSTVFEINSVWEKPAGEPDVKASGSGLILARPLDNFLKVAVWEVVGLPASVTEKADKLSGSGKILNIPDPDPLAMLKAQFDSKVLELRDTLVPKEHRMNVWASTYAAAIGYGRNSADAKVLASQAVRDFNAFFGE